MNILICCSGNSCRSPIAMALAKKIYPEHHFDSAGYWEALVGDNIRPEKTEEDHAVIALNGLEHESIIGYQNKKLSTALIEWSNKILILGQHDSAGNELNLIEDNLKDNENVKYWSMLSNHNIYVPDPWDIDGFNQFTENDISEREGQRPDNIEPEQWKQIEIGETIYYGGGSESYAYTATYLSENLKIVIDKIL